LRKVHRARVRSFWFGRGSSCGSEAFAIYDAFCQIFGFLAVVTCKSQCAQHSRFCSAFPGSALIRFLVSFRQLAPRLPGPRSRCLSSPRDSLARRQHGFSGLVELPEAGREGAGRQAPGRVRRRCTSHAGDLARRLEADQGEVLRGLGQRRLDGGRRPLSLAGARLFQESGILLVQSPS
jgi:hypothetical protein